MNTTKTELLEEFDNDGAMEDLLDSYPEIHEYTRQLFIQSLDRYRDSVVDWFEKEVIGEDGTDTREDLGETLWMAQWGRNDLRTEQRQLLKRKL